MSRTNRGEEMLNFATNHPARWLTNYLVLPGRALNEAIYMPISKESSRADRLLEGLTMEFLKLIPYGFAFQKLAIDAGEYLGR